MEKQPDATTEAEEDAQARLDLEATSDVSSLQERGNLEIEQCFQVLQHELVDGDWELAAEAEGATAGYIQREGSNTCWVRLTAPIRHMCYEDKFWTALPEIGAEFNLFTSFRMQVLRLIAPGDAVVRFAFLSPEVAMSAVALSGSLYCNVRISLRQDFPRPGTTALVFSPPHSGGIKLFPNLATMFYFVTIEKMSDEIGFFVHHYMQLPWETFPDWAAPNLLQMAQVETMRYRPEHPIYQELKSFYVVLSLQSRAGGPPLLPVCLEAKTKNQSKQAGGYLWRSTLENKDDFNFAIYLSSFFEAMGHRIQVWDSLAGRFLVPYQAVLVGSDWERISPSFYTLYGSQRTAYRKLYGIATAPKIKESKDLRYTDLWTTEVPNWEDNVLVERNTFLTVAKNNEKHTVPRSAEYP